MEMRSCKEVGIFDDCAMATVSVDTRSLQAALTTVGNLNTMV